MGEKATLAQFKALLGARHSCRAFLPEPVDAARIEAMIEAAQKVPSWCNAQPWQLVVTRGRATEAFRAAMQRAMAEATARPDIPFPAAYEGVYRERRRECGWQLYDSVGVARGDRAASALQMAENYRFFGAPHVAVVTTEAALGAYGVLDCGAFVTAFLLAAEAEGIAAIAQAAIAAYGAEVRAHFGLPGNRQVVCAIAFGHEDRDHPANGFRTTRAGLEEVVDWRG